MYVWTVKIGAGSQIPQDLYDLGLSILDNDSQARIKRFHFRQDAERCLLGRLLPRLLLKYLYNVPPSEAVFGRTSSGKPYIERPHGLRNRVGFNVSHDGKLVAMAFQFAEEIDHTPNFKGQSRDAPDTCVVNRTNLRDDHSRDRLDSSEIGIDIMKIALPSPESKNLEQDLEDFIESVSDALTPLELHQLRLPSQTPPRSTRATTLMRLFSTTPTSLASHGAGAAAKTTESPLSTGDCDGRGNCYESDRPMDMPYPDAFTRRLMHIFLLWTLKESYTKALGLGLGFDFKRVEYDCERDAFRVDKRPVRGWEIGVGLVDLVEEEHQQFETAATESESESKADTERAGPTTNTNTLHKRVRYMVAVSRRLVAKPPLPKQNIIMYEDEIGLGHSTEPEARVQVREFKSITPDRIRPSGIIRLNSNSNSGGRGIAHGDEDRGLERTLEPSSSSSWSSFPLPSALDPHPHPSPSPSPSPQSHSKRNLHPNPNPDPTPTLHFRDHDQDPDHNQNRNECTSGTNIDTLPSAAPDGETDTDTGTDMRGKTTDTGSNNTDANVSANLVPFIHHTHFDAETLIRLACR